MITHKIISGTLTYTGCQLLGRKIFNCKSNGFSEKFSGNTACWTTISSWSWVRVSKGVRAILSRPSPIRQPAPLDSARLSSSSKIKRVDPSQTVLSSRAVLIWVLPFTVVSCVACQLTESSSPLWSSLPAVRAPVLNPYVCHRHPSTSLLSPSTLLWYCDSGSSSSCLVVVIVNPSPSCHRGPAQDIITQRNGMHEIASSTSSSFLMPPYMLKKMTTAGTYGKERLLRDRSTLFFIELLLISTLGTDRKERAPQT